MNISIATVYPDKASNPYLIEMFQLIAFRRANPLTFIRACRKNKQPKYVKQKHIEYIPCQKHHIIPKCVFNFYHLKIDESFENTIYLTKSEHAKVHRLLQKYYESKPQKTHEIFYYIGGNRKAANLLDAIQKPAKSSWEAYNEEQRQQRCKNISIGTKHAMTSFSKEKKEQIHQRLLIGTKLGLKNIDPKIKEQQRIGIKKYHLGSIMMSNEELHQFRYVSKNEIQQYLDNGWVKGNKSKEWIAQGYIKIKPGKFAKP